MAASRAVALRTVFMVLGCVFAAVLIYTAATDGLAFYTEFLNPWSVAILVDFCITIFPIAAWIVYKESSWILSIIWIHFLFLFGSAFTCLFIAVQFLKLSPQESINDPIYFVLLRKRKPDEMESKSILSVASARVLFSLLGCLMLAILVYTNAVHGSQFSREIFTRKWVLAALVDAYFHTVILSVWVAYKESNWKTAALWIILFFVSEVLLRVPTSPYNFSIYRPKIPPSLFFSATATGAMKDFYRQKYNNFPARYGASWSI